MKKILFSVALLFAFSVAFSQVEKGTVLLGGSVGFNTNHYNSGKYYNEDQTSYDLSPAVGYFFTDHFAAGLELNYNHRKYNYESSDPANIYGYSDKTNGYGVGPFVRYYKSLSDKVALFGHGSFIYNGYQTKRVFDSSTNNNFTLNNSGFNASLRPGIVFFPAKKFGFQLTAGSIGYSTSKNNYDLDNYDDTKTSNFNINLGISSWTIGAFLYL